MTPTKTNNVDDWTFETWSIVCKNRAPQYDTNINIIENWIQAQIIWKIVS
jgi:hypothetical protein